MNRIAVVAMAGLLMACSAFRSSAQKPADETAPELFRVNIETSKGPVVVEVTRSLAPHGADRFYTLVKNGYFDGARFFRVVPGFVVQFGMAADPKVNKVWDTPIQDDPVKVVNERGTLVFAATSQPNSRTTQMFINLVDNPRLDGMGFSPFAKVVSGMEAVDAINSEYREMPDQGRIGEEGNTYLEKEFPNLDFIKTAKIAGK